MSLNNLYLQTPLITSLYKTSLVSNTPNKNPVLPTTQKERILFLGGNSKNICVVVETATDSFLEESSLAFLSNILSACGLLLNDVAIVNAHKNNSVNYQNLQAQFAPSHILFFGVEPASIGFPIQFPHYKIQKHNNQIYLIASALPALKDRLDEKKLLWAALQTIFKR